VVFFTSKVVKTTRSDLGELWREKEVYKHNTAIKLIYPDIRWIEDVFGMRHAAIVKRMSKRFQSKGGEKQC